MKFNFPDEVLTANDLSQFYKDFLYKTIKQELDEDILKNPNVDDIIDEAISRIKIYCDFTVVLEEEK